MVMLTPDSGPSFARVTAKADADARFQMNGVVAGRYRIVASARTVQILDGFGGISEAPLTDARARARAAEYLEVDSDVESLRVVAPAQAQE
jgi:hypothetical protein